MAPLIKMLSITLRCVYRTFIFISKTPQTLDNTLRYSRIKIIMVLFLLTLVIQLPLSFGQDSDDINPKGSAINLVVERFSTVENPIGLSWKATEFLVSVADGEDTKLYALSSDGETLTPFAPSFSGKGNIYLAVSDDISGFKLREIYLNSGDTIYHSDQRGTNIQPFATPVPGIDVTHIIFDEFGYWGSNLIASTADGGIWMISSNGETSKIVTLDDYPLSIAPGPDEYGLFTGNLLVALRDSQKIVGIDPNDHHVKTLFEFTDEIPRLVLVIFPFSNMYFTDTIGNSIFTIPQDAFTKTSRFVIVLTENKDGKTGSIKVIEATRKEVKVIDEFTDIENPSFGGAVFVQEEEVSNAPERKVEEDAFRLDPILFGTTVTIIIIAITSIVFWRFRRR